MSDDFDVAVVGAGPAGCATAMFLGRSGLRVALLESHKDPDFYKRLCTHSIRASALPTIRRLGLDAEFDRLGGVHHHERGWTKAGWFTERPEEGSYGYNIRRSTVDPALRAVAAAVPGVDLMLGTRVKDLGVGGAGRVDGVVVDCGGRQRHLTARLVVGADGCSSKVAQLSGLPGRVSPGRRFAFLACYRNVGFPVDWTGAMWIREPDMCYSFRNDDGVTVLVAMPDKGRQSEFREDRERALIRTFEGLPDAPDMSAAERVSDVIGTMDYPSITRRRIVRPGVALVGDAAMVGDPVWGTGCGWALQTAEWLSDAVSGPLRAGSDRAVDAGARRYQWRHRRMLLPHQMINIDYSRRAGFNGLERLLYQAAPHDAKIAEHVTAVGRRLRSPLSLLAPTTIARAVVVNRRATSAVSAPSSMP